MERSDLAMMFASILHGIDRARRMGDEPRADVPLDKVFRNGAVQPLLFSPEDL